MNSMWWIVSRLTLKGWKLYSSFYGVIQCYLSWSFTGIYQVIGIWQPSKVYSLVFFKLHYWVCFMIYHQIGLQTLNVTVRALKMHNIWVSQILLLWKNWPKNNRWLKFVQITETVGISEERTYHIFCEILDLKKLSMRRTKSKKGESSFIRR